MNRPTPPLAAYGVALLGVALFTAMDAVMKGFSLAIGVYSAMVWRSLAGTAVSAVPWLAGGRPLLDRAVLRLHVWRGVVVAAMAITFFFGLTRLPMAQVIAIAFIAPVITMLLAALLLGERIGSSAWIGSGIAVAGMAVIAGWQAFTGIDGPRQWIGMAAVIFSATCYAYNIILQRRQAQIARPVEIAFFQNLVPCVIFVAAVPVIGVNMPGAHWPSPIAAGLLVTVSQLLFAWAYARADASYLVTVEYSGFVWAALFGWIAFGETVSAGTLAGAALIVAGCLVAARKRPADMPMEADM